MYEGVSVSTGVGVSVYDGIGVSVSTGTDVSVGPGMGVSVSATTGVSAGDRPSCAHATSGQAHTLRKTHKSTTPIFAECANFEGSRS